MTKMSDRAKIYKIFDSQTEQSKTDIDASWEEIKVAGGVNINTPAGADFLLCYASAEGTPLKLDF